MKRSSKRPRFAGEGRALSRLGLCGTGLTRTFLVSRGISVKQGKRHSRRRDDRAEGHERRPPTERNDKPGIHRIEGSGTGRGTGAENSHRCTARPHEPARDDRGRRDNNAGDTRGAKNAEAQVVLRERHRLSRQRQGHTEDQSAHRHDRPRSPAVVEPAGNRREDDETKPAERVAERRRAASPGELVEDRDIEKGEGGSCRPRKSVYGRGDTDHGPSIRAGLARSTHVGSVAPWAAHMFHATPNPNARHSPSMAKGKLESRHRKHVCMRGI